MLKENNTSKTVPKHVTNDVSYLNIFKWVDFSSLQFFVAKYRQSEALPTDMAIFKNTFFHNFYLFLSNWKKKVHVNSDNSLSIKQWEMQKKQKKTFLSQS